MIERQPEYVLGRFTAELDTGAHARTRAGRVEVHVLGDRIRVGHGLARGIVEREGRRAGH